MKQTIDVYSFVGFVWIIAFYITFFYISQISVVFTTQKVFCKRKCTQFSPENEEKISMLKDTFM